MELMGKIPNWKYKDFVDNDFVISGSPKTVTQKLMDAVKKLRVGNLMVLLHIGSMPHDLTMKNVELFCKRSVSEFPRHVGRPVGKQMVAVDAAGKRARAQIHQRSRAGSGG